MTVFAVVFDNRACLMLASLILAGFGLMYGLDRLCKGARK